MHDFTFMQINKKYESNLNVIENKFWHLIKQQLNT
jgi:hypothetical protein